MSSPRISVVCPVFNRGHLIKHCIHSIIDQSFEDWELILVDDGSQDNTESECRRFLVDKRIKYFKIPHCGHIGKVRNFGNKKAKGELIVVQDSDDLSLPDRLEVIWETYQHSMADVFYHGVYQVYPYVMNKGQMEYNNGVILKKYRKPEIFDKDRLIHEQYIFAQIATTRKAALACPYDETVTVCDDWIWLIELALKGYEFHPIYNAVYEYWWSADSANIEGEKDGRRANDMKYIMNKLRTKYNIDVISTETKDENGKTTKVQYSDDSGDQATSNQTR